MDTSKFNKQLEMLNNLEVQIPLAVKIQREGGDTVGALNALRDIVNTAIGIYTPGASFESFRRGCVIEQAFDKARLVYLRAGQPAKAAASGIVAYFMGIKRLAACADYKAGVAAEERDPLYQAQNEINPEDARQTAAAWESEARENLAAAYAAMTDTSIRHEIIRLLKKVKIDTGLVELILPAVSQPADNPWEMFNSIMSAITY